MKTSDPVLRVIVFDLDWEMQVFFERAKCLLEFRAWPMKEMVIDTARDILPRRD